MATPEACAAGVQWCAVNCDWNCDQIKRTSMLPNSVFWALPGEATGVRYVKAYPTVFEAYEALRVAVDRLGLVGSDCWRDDLVRRTLKGLKLL